MSGQSRANPSPCTPDMQKRPKCPQSKISTHYSTPSVTLLRGSFNPPRRSLAGRPVALIIRLKPAEGLVFEGNEPAGYSGEVIGKSDWGVGLGLDDFFRLRKSKALIPSRSDST